MKLWIPNDGSIELKEIHKGVDFLKNNQINSISKNKQIRTVTRNVTARKGEGIILQSDGGTDIDLHLRYS